MSKIIAAQHILVEQKFEAEDILKKLHEGEDFGALAKNHSNCGSAQQEGHLGEFKKGMMVPDFEKAAFALEVGEVSGIVPTRFGHHIIKRTK